MSVANLISYLSAAIVLLFGVLLLTGIVFGAIEASYRISFGLVVIVYAGVRFVMLYYASRRRAKNS